ncbi:hypothetical protein, partial [Burkholderia pseudomallei]|uniref:hypothetical protein n=1 Tax=Burkholderia pseudomallei TaxID=28450 RepID=UPI001C3CDF7B
MFAPLASIRAANRYRSITGAGRSALGRPIVRARSPARLGPLRRDRPHAIRARSIFFANPRTTQGRIEPWCKPCMPADRIRSSDRTSIFTKNAAIVRGVSLGSMRRTRHPACARADA